MPEATNYSIRPIQESDAPAVLEIYNYYVEHTIISFEFESPTLEEFIQRIKTNTEKYPWLVCLCNDKIIGYAYGSTHRYRSAYQWSPESTIYLDQNFHTKGIGKILYQTLFQLLKLQGYFTVFAGVGLPNEKSVRLHRSLGFEDIGVFKNIGFKHGNWHSTHWFQRQLSSYTLNPTPPKHLSEIKDDPAFKTILHQANQQIALLTASA